MVPAMKFSVILWGLARLLNHTARKHPEFRERLKERNLVAQIMARDEGSRPLVSSSATARSSPDAAAMQSRT